MASGVTMSIWDALLQGLFTIVIVVIGGLIVRVFISRTFKGIDDSIKNVEKKVDAMDYVPSSECDLKMEKGVKLENKIEHASEDIIRLQEAAKTLEALKQNADRIDKLRVEFLEKYQPKADFIREMAILNSQVESIHKMITRLDDKLDLLKKNPGDV